MPGKGTTDTLFILQRMQEKYNKKKSFFVDMEKAFDRVPRKVMEWAMRKKELPEVIVKAVMSLYEGARRESELNPGYRKNFLWKLEYTKDQCYYHCCLL